MDSVRALRLFESGCIQCELHAEGAPQDECGAGAEPELDFGGHNPELDLWPPKSSSGAEGAPQDECGAGAEPELEFGGHNPEQDMAPDPLDPPLVRCAENCNCVAPALANSNKIIIPSSLASQLPKNLYTPKVFQLLFTTNVEN